ncbi:MAG: YegS/Rv2252/BmrU family lipid kinase [Oscillospiraceae bacterium]|nr:YegS/Rv2252/BmrU family lipid kinase [Oscillospiraceae bacterium]
MKKLLLILNPASGTKKASKRLSEIISVFNRADFATQVFVTEKSGDATRAVITHGKDAELIVCCGGDGTLNETVTGLLTAGLETPIGYIPSGSTNDFANSLKLPTDVVRAARQIVSGSPTAYDVGTFGERFFTYVASFGAFTKTSYETPQNIKNTFGHMAYILEGIQELSGIRREHIKIEADSECFEDNYLFGAICNSRSIGGILTLSPDLVDMSDGKFEILLVRAPREVSELSECILALKHQTYNCGMITFRSASSLTVSASADMTWSLDGERADGAEKIHIKNLPRKITLIH